MKSFGDLTKKKNVQMMEILWNKRHQVEVQRQFEEEDNPLLNRRWRTLTKLMSARKEKKTKRGYAETEAYYKEGGDYIEWLTDKDVFMLNVPHEKRNKHDTVEDPSKAREREQ